eukprot:CAMPEP_0204067978 /NCGR_PEP_ID=MMETSP0360-20130528/154473_1 /ASSEMBLY_ACC=CAM_ASM_000342 /TAXON_ID=268821 /ORGANISM="Scrippsiella Hangoei, Strain SHTV-5" /LENGTH=65 /DNA_ID=CAMNT_0051016087 /DNA_START=10 /DNA_END=204 /DNA_ORIENTATION=-
MNVMPVAGAKLLMALTDGGAQHLLAGARAGAGVKQGRYLFEVRIVETFAPEAPAGRGVPGGQAPQ